MLSPVKGRLAVKEIALLGVFLGYTLVISLIERMIPLSFTIPGIRLGLANVAIVLGLYLFPLSRALLLLVMKCLMAAIFGGSPAALLYSLGGSLLSFVVMVLLLRLFRDHISPIGLSIAGAAFHNTGQILVACLLLESWYVIIYLPILLLVGIITGAIIGILVRQLRPFLAAYTGVGTETGFS
jgi:heptaprenyl diphosphate synthase